MAPALLLVMAKSIALFASRSEDPPKARSVAMCAAVSLTVALSGTSGNARTVSISATVTPVTRSVPPLSSAAADPAPSFTPATCICASVRETTPALLTVIPVIVPRAARMPEEPPSARSAWMWAAVSLIVIVAGETSSARIVSISATATPVTISEPPVTFAITDPAPSFTPATSTWADVSVIAPALLLVIAVMSVRFVSRSEDAPRARSVAICAAVSLTVIDAGATPRPRIVSISATVTPVTIREPPVTFASTEPAPSLTPAA